MSSLRRLFAGLGAATAATVFAVLIPVQARAAENPTLANIAIDVARRPRVRSGYSGAVCGLICCGLVVAIIVIAALLYMRRRGGGRPGVPGGYGPGTGATPPPASGPPSPPSGPQAPGAEPPPSTPPPSTPPPSTPPDSGSLPPSAPR